MDHNTGSATGDCASRKARLSYPTTPDPVSSVTRPADDGEDGEEDVGGEDNKNTERMRASLHSTEDTHSPRPLIKQKQILQKWLCMPLSVKLDTAPIQAHIPSTFC